MWDTVTRRVWLLFATLNNACKMYWYPVVIKCDVDRDDYDDSKGGGGGGGDDDDALAGWYQEYLTLMNHGDGMSSTRFPHCWPYGCGNHRWPVDFPHRMAIVCTLPFFFFLSTGKGCWPYSRISVDSRRLDVREYDVIVMCKHTKINLVSTDISLTLIIS